MKKHHQSLQNLPITNRIKILFFELGYFHLVLFMAMLISCSKDSSGQAPVLPNGTGTIKGTVQDENGNPYPNTLVKLSQGAETQEKATDAQGIFEMDTKSTGTYEVTLVPPLSTEVVTNIPFVVNVQSDQTAAVEIEIRPQPVEVHLNFGEVQILEEIVNKDGYTPTDANEPLFAANIFDAPLGLLTAIKAPDGHHVILSEFKEAMGNLTVHCNGNTATVEVALEGMIPNGTYTFWLAYLNKARRVGENIDFANDFVNFSNSPIGAPNGTENIAIAESDGTINITLEHSSCILTDEVALVIPILYHINGKTFGGGHVPDPEEMVHMLAYFQ